MLRVVESLPLEANDVYSVRSAHGTFADMLKQLSSNADYDVRTKAAALLKKFPRSAVTDERLKQLLAAPPVRFGGGGGGMGMMRGGAMGGMGMRPGGGGPFGMGGMGGMPLAMQQQLMQRQMMERQMMEQQQQQQGGGGGGGGGMDGLGGGGGGGGNKPRLLRPLKDAGPLPPPPPLPAGGLAGMQGGGGGDGVEDGMDVDGGAGAGQDALGLPPLGPGRLGPRSGGVGGRAPVRLLSGRHGHGHGHGGGMMGANGLMGSRHAHGMSPSPLHAASPLGVPPSPAPGDLHAHANANASGDDATPLPHGSNKRRKHSHHDPHGGDGSAGYYTALPGPPPRHHPSHAPYPPHAYGGHPPGPPHLRGDREPPGPPPLPGGVPLPPPPPLPAAMALAGSASAGVLRAVRELPDRLTAEQLVTYMLRPRRGKTGRAAAEEAARPTSDVPLLCLHGRPTSAVGLFALGVYGSFGPPHTKREPAAQASAAVGVKAKQEEVQEGKGPKREAGPAGEQLGGQHVAAGSEGADAAAVVVKQEVKAEEEEHGKGPGPMAEDEPLSPIRTDLHFSPIVDRSRPPPPPPLLPPPPPVLPASALPLPPPPPVTGHGKPPTPEAQPELSGLRPLRVAAWDGLGSGLGLAGAGAGGPGSSNSTPTLSQPGAGWPGSGTAPNTATAASAAAAAGAGAGGTALPPVVPVSSLSDWGPEPEPAAPVAAVAVGAGAPAAGGSAVPPVARGSPGPGGLPQGSPAPGAAAAVAQPQDDEAAAMEGESDELIGGESELRACARGRQLLIHGAHGSCRVPHLSTVAAPTPYCCPRTALRSPPGWLPPAAPPKVIDMYACCSAPMLRHPLRRVAAPRVRPARRGVGGAGRRVRGLPVRHAAPPPGQVHAAGAPQPHQQAGGGGAARKGAGTRAGERTGWTG